MVLAVTELFNTVANDFDAKKSARYGWESVPTGIKIHQIEMQYKLSFMVCLHFPILIPKSNPMELDFIVISRRGYSGHRLIPMNVSILMQMGTSPNWYR